ncbi:hypothetical protein GQ457_11G012640 [Hibiscus cannabinus]
MQLLSFFLHSSVLVLALFMSTKADDEISKTLIVDQSGHGDFTDIQSAIDSIPSDNNAWIVVRVKAGIYNEMVNIPRDKPKIYLQGESKQSTIIQFGDGGDSIKSSTFSSNADDFVATDITFKNTHNLEPGKPLTWAPAALINADKASFYRCGFVSVQDTLTDSHGRHYFENCYIEGVVDFIWGNGRSIFQGCVINVTTSSGHPAGYITAQARDSAADDTGFVFKDCSIIGSSAYLGRAYRSYARVLFFRTKMSASIVPEGWSAWHYVGKDSVLVLALFMSTKADGGISKTLIVDQSGRGDFTSIQSAIDSIPSKNNVWTLVHVKAGVYNEMVNIPRDKPKIHLQGESRRSTIIQFGAGGDSSKSTTFSSHAEDFVATDITFKNTHNLEPGKPLTWAPAALINADKASFYRCGFVSVQDTLTDNKGRHYFENCYIEGVMDFIWGNGRSIYQGCVINVTTSPGHRAGYITAQARNSAADNTGFVFKHSLIIGTGSAYLGRAYRPYSRVVFFRSKMSDSIVPQGWSAWHYVGKESTIVFAEVDCIGVGANKSKRVTWEKNLSPKELKYLLKSNIFINEEGWIQSQPKATMVL